MPNGVLKLDERDNVIIALESFRQGDRVRMGETEYTLVSDVPAKYKFATDDLAIGDSVIMYGVLVGKAVAPIRRGEVITVRNLRHEASPFQENTEISVESARCFEMAREDIPRLSPRRWPSRHAKSLAGDPARLLRKPQHRHAETGLRRGVGIRCSANLPPAGRGIGAAVPRRKK